MAAYTEALNHAADSRYLYCFSSAVIRYIMHIAASTTTCVSEPRCPCVCERRAKPYSKGCAPVLTSTHDDDSSITLNAQTHHRPWRLSSSDQAKRATYTQRSTHMGLPRFGSHGTAPQGIAALLNAHNPCSTCAYAPRSPHGWFNCLSHENAPTT